jgi:4-hydroxyphenylpyruvate dioxygenase
MEALNKTNYNGYLSLEIFNDSYRSGPRDLIAKDGQRSLKSLIYKSKIEKKQKVEINNIEFIEFATNEENLEQLENILCLMGFTEIGQHRNKRIKLFVFDDVKFIINYENNPLIEENSKYGPFPYAYGININDLSFLFKQADFLNIDLIKKQENLNISMDAIKNIDGLVYVIDNNDYRIWEKDFKYLPELKTNNFNLKIDHIAQTLHHDEMPSSLLSYSTLFDCKKSPVIDIIDPDGIIKSQVIENETKTFRMTMNGAENSKTNAGQFLKKNKRPGIQHIALSSNNLIGLVNELKSKGQSFLKVSDNYYDDIEARFGLDFNFCNELKELNILYDEDENGSFLQVYTNLINNTFFFEIVQRINNYQGYGANNALFRIAAQKNMI